tara:strand:- start:51 stop:170 length:120 start_codon:yes stop_codon:yes gene_type:complete
MPTSDKVDLYQSKEGANVNAPFLIVISRLPFAYLRLIDR